MKKILYTLLLSLSHFLLKSQILSVQLSKTDETCTKGSANIAISGGQQPYSITWSNGVNNVTSIGDLNEGIYQVRIEDANQNDTIIDFNIQKEICKVYISNHFTPNGDNYNDTWQIAQTQYYPRMKLYVYNKWGQQVHAQSGSYIPWEGTHAGLPVADGTYYYIFYYDSNDQGNYIKGDVTILR